MNLDPIAKSTVVSLKNISSFDLSIFEARWVITLGLRKNAREYQKALLSSNCWISSWAKSLLFNPQFFCAQQQNEVSLTVVTPQELGLGGWPKYDQVCERGVELGLALCPAEVGPALALEIARLRKKFSWGTRLFRWANSIDERARMGGQPRPWDDWHLLAMNPITSISGGHAFEVNKIIADMSPENLRDDEQRPIQWLHSMHVPVGDTIAGHSPRDTRFIFALPSH